MAWYNYYQNSQPTWGTAQYQAIAPPMPTYQPQPSWHGADYYRAHANDTDNTIFDYVWSKVRNLVTGAGVGRKEAAHLWERVYSGMVDPIKLLPREIGAAAGYEAVRCWEHHKSIYVQPLGANPEREREALIGVATAEASRLWAYTRRPHDKYGRLEASEVAASTASRIFTQAYERDSPYEPYDRYPRERRRSIGTTSYNHRPSLSHRRSSSFYRRSPSPFALGAPSNAVGLSSSAVAPYSAQFYSGGPPGTTTGFAPGMQGAYYPTAPTVGGYPYGAMSGSSPYLNQPYVGSSVGLPPPPTGQYLTAPPLTHRRSHSTSAYDAVRPSLGYY